MKSILRTLALVTALIVTGWWLAQGPNRGWTKTSVTRFVKDPVTEIDGPVIENRFVPGVDFLAAGLLGAVVCFGLSLFFRKK